MKQFELLLLMDREAELLTQDNWHQSALLMRLAADQLRRMHQLTGMDNDDIPDCAELAKLIPDCDSPEARRAAIERGQ